MNWKTRKLVLKYLYFGMAVLPIFGYVPGLRVNHADRIIISYFIDRGVTCKWDGGGHIGSLNTIMIRFYLFFRHFCQQGIGFAWIERKVESILFEQLFTPIFKLQYEINIGHPSLLRFGKIKPCDDVVLKWKKQREKQNMKGSNW